VEDPIMEITDVLAQAREAMTVKRVFGDPIERDGLTVIPVANVMGGGGAGGGESSMPAGADAEATSGTAPGMASGSGVGFGLRATPAGVYVIKDGEVEWEPALDLTRIAIMGQLVGIFFLFVVWRLIRAWIRR
jgi:uncharacterized spore protein YtfJ